jgi:hypothetical protein
VIGLTGIGDHDARNGRSSWPECADRSPGPISGPKAKVEKRIGAVDRVPILAAQKRISIIKIERREHVRLVRPIGPNVYTKMDDVGMGWARDADEHNEEREQTGRSR